MMSDDPEARSNAAFNWRLSCAMENGGRKDSDRSIKEETRLRIFRLEGGEWRTSVNYARPWFNTGLGYCGINKLCGVLYIDVHE